MLLCLFKHENTRRNAQIIKIMGNFSENIKTNWTGFIGQQSDLIDQRTGLFCGQIRPVRQQIGPVYIVLIFIIIFLFFPYVLFFSAERIISSESAYKTAYSETPFNEMQQWTITEIG